MTARQLAQGWVSCDVAAKSLPLSADEVRVRCALFISSKGRDRTALRCINVNASGARLPRYAIPESELTDWPARQMSAVGAGGVL